MNKSKLIILSIILVCSFVLIININQYDQRSQQLLKKQNHHIQILNEYGIQNMIDQSYNDDELKLPRYSEIKSIKTFINDQGQVDQEISEYIKDAWKDYKHACKKNYSSEEEEQQRFELWKKKFIKIEENNEMNRNFTESEYCSMDLTYEEWQSTQGGLNIDDEQAQNWNQIVEENKKFNHDQKIPDYVSWKKLKLPIRNQKCGDCWANAQMTTQEALWQIIGNDYREFSVQEMIDCVQQGGGCNGGWGLRGYEYEAKYGSIPYENDPYEGAYNPQDQCYRDSKYKSDNINFVEGVVRINENDCQGVRAAVARQPVSVCFEVTSQFQATRSEIFPANARRVTGKCNHEVTVVGYTPEYWVIQNSWGKTNGYNGYFRLEMGNTMNFCQYAYYPKTSKPYKLTPKTEKYDFLQEFSDSSSQGGQNGINLMSFIGTKFKISSSNYKKTIQNLKGEKLDKIMNKYYYVPEGRDKTDFNFYRIAFIFIDQNTQSSFDLVFEPNKWGFLTSTNIQGDQLYLGQCVVNNLGPACDGLKDTSIYIWNKDSSFLVALTWLKP